MSRSSAGFFLSWLAGKRSRRSIFACFIRCWSTPIRTVFYWKRTRWLAGWARQIGCTLKAVASDTGEPGYVLSADGWQMDVALPLRRAESLMGEAMLRMTGRVSVNGVSLAFPTAPEQLWEAYLGWLTEQEWTGAPPHFHCLLPVASFPFGRESLNYGHEALDLGEALSEEFYFGGQEYLPAA